MAARAIDAAPPLAELLDDLRLVSRYLDRCADERSADYVIAKSHARRLLDVVRSLETIRDAVGDISECATALAGALEATRTASALVVTSATELADVIGDLSDFFGGTNGENHAETDAH